MPAVTADLDPVLQPRLLNRFRLLLQQFMQNEGWIMRKPVNEKTRRIRKCPTNQADDARKYG